MRIAIVGHSFVRDLSNLGDTEGILPNQTKYTVQYYSIPGSTVFDWAKNPKEFRDCVSWNPDFVVVVLGGNSITDNNSDSDIRRKYNDFLDLIDEKLPFAKIVATQVELRDYQVPNKFHAPAFTEFKRRRDRFNDFLRRNKGVHFRACVGGPKNLDDFELYYQSEGKHKVHLNQFGLLKLNNILIRTVIKALERS